MHKGDRGKILIAGGSKHYPGAPSLTALAALRSGAGVVTLLSNEFTCFSCASRFPEVVYHIEDNKNKWADFVLDEKSIETFDTLIAGPGLERSEEAQEFIIKIWNEWPGKILIDGDGLFALAEHQEDLKFREDAVITPHEGEAARLLKTNSKEVNSNRRLAVKILSDKWGCAVLKGNMTLIKDKADSEIYKIEYGGPELSVPGSGDVLSGCIGAFLAFGFDVLDASILGASIHGMAGDYLRVSGGVDGVLASDIANALRIIIHDLREY